MNDTPVSDGFGKVKAWYKSKTIIGVIVAAVGAIIRAFFPEVDVVGAIDEVLNADDVASGVDNVWSGGLQVFGLILALYGRVKAKLGIGTE